MLFLKLFSIMGYYKTLTRVPCVHRFLHRHMFLFLLSIYLGMELVGHVVTLGFPGGSDGKVSACNAGDPGSIPGSGRSPGEGNGNHSSTLAWKIPWTEEPCRLQSMGSQRVGHDGATSLHFTSR